MVGNLMGAGGRQITMNWRGIILIIVFGTVIAACGEPSGAPDQPTNLGDGSAAADHGPFEGSWMLSEGIPVVPGYPITLTAVGDAQGGTITGTSACNSYFGEYTLDGPSITIDQLGATEMGCEPGVSASESAYMQAITGVTAWEVTGETLVLTGADVLLTFVLDPPLPTAALVGTTWILVTLSEGDMAWTPVGEPAVLVLNEDGSFEGSTGCRSLSGRWEEDGASIDFPEMAADGECAPDVRDQDSLVVGVLGDGFRPSIDGDLLTIESVGSQTLVYRSGMAVDAANEPEPTLIATCGGAALGNALAPVLPSDPLPSHAVEALEPYVSAVEGEEAFFSRYDWSLSAETATSFTVFGRANGSSDGYADARFELRDGTWTAVGWGTCHPTVAVDSEAWGVAAWVLDPDTRPDPASTEVAMWVIERNCANGEAPVGRDIEAITIEDDDRLIVTVLIQPIWAVPGQEGASAACPGNPWHPVVLDLGVAADGRPLYDGGTTPPEERAWPPTHPDLFLDD